MSRTSARVNQPASTSSTPSTRDRLVESVRAEPDHQARRERPRLRGDVDHLAHPYARLFRHLPADRVLQALADLDEAGERRPPAGRCAPVPGEQAAVGGLDQRDHRRHDAREEQLPAALAGAQVAALPHDGRPAARAAEPLVAVPVQQPAGLAVRRRGRRVEGGEQRPHVAGAGRAGGRQRVGLVQRREVDGEHRHLAVEAEEDVRFPRRGGGSVTGRSPSTRQRSRHIGSTRARGSASAAASQASSDRRAAVRSSGFPE